MKDVDYYLSPAIEDFFKILFTLPATEEAKGFFDWLYPPEDRLASWSTEVHNDIISKWHSNMAQHNVYCLSCLSQLGVCTGGAIRFSCPNCCNSSTAFGYYRHSALNRVSHYGSDPVVIHYLNSIRRA